MNIKNRIVFTTTLSVAWMDLNSIRDSFAFSDHDIVVVRRIFKKQNSWSSVSNLSLLMLTNIWNIPLTWKWYLASYMVFCFKTIHTQILRDDKSPTHGGTSLRRSRINICIRAGLMHAGRMNICMVHKWTWLDTVIGALDCTSELIFISVYYNDYNKPTFLIFSLRIAIQGDDDSICRISDSVSSICIEDVY